MGNNPISSLVFVPPEPATYTEEIPAKCVFIKTKSNKKIPAYYLKNSKDVKTTLLYSHGNAADIGAMYDFLKLLRDNLPCNVLHYEYIGYGLAKQDGITPSESGAYESVEAAFNYLITEQKLSESDIIIFGTSVGSGPSCYIASQKKVKGLILECPFLSIVRIVTNVMLARAVDMFDNYNRITKVNCPVLIFHGRKDEVVPFDHGKELFSRVQPAFQKEFVDLPDADHHNIIERLTLYTYIKKLNEFIGYCDTFKAQQQSKGNDEKASSVSSLLSSSSASS